ncbi:hypothetical protein GF360_01295 [candidate division WWE3 bacterium]|nr:hypothetical protein [candidate division WWE3 bacterium]
MFSKILIKLIDEAIVPAILLLTVRLVSVILISQYLEIPYSISNSGFVFNSPEDYLKINSYSLIAMLAALVLGLGITLVKSLFLHDSHITPKLTAKVFSLKMSSFIQNSFEIYSQGAIWVSYLYLLLLVAGIMAIFSLVYSWVFYVNLAVGIIASVLFIVDVEKEIDISKLEGSDFDYYEDAQEDFILEFGDDYV